MKLVPGRRERARPGARRLLTSLFGDRPSPLEIVLGRERYLPTLLRAEGLWVTIVSLVGLVGLLAARGAELRDYHPGVVAVLLALVVIGGAWLVARADHVSHRMGNLLVAVAVGGILVIVGLLGPDLQVSTTVIVAAGISNFVFQRGRVATLSSITLAIGYAVLLATQDGYDAPVARWLVVVVSMVASSVSLAWLVGIVEGLAVQERAGRLELDTAHAELASLNDQLERRVNEQADEIGALRRLRRFLSPQVAEAVLRDGDGTVLGPHRQRIAVIFCELRGFTTFANEVAPEDVIEVLDEWFETLGGLFDRYEATVGSLAGESVMAYFGDPVPHPDPAGAAIEMALELRRPMEDLLAAWQRRGFTLGYGVGISFGYATMGTIGFHRRSEYTPLGNVVNLASRLCEAAGDGGILVDDRAHVVVGDRVVAGARVVALRGYREPVTAHELVAWLPLTSPGGTNGAARAAAAAAPVVPHTRGQG